MWSERASLWNFLQTKKPRAFLGAHGFDLQKKCISATPQTGGYSQPEVIIGSVICRRHQIVVAPESCHRIDFRR